VEVGDFRKITDLCPGRTGCLLRENRRFVTDEFEKYPVEVGDFRRIIDLCRGRTGGSLQMNRLS
jgi:hypothetical protein